MGGRPEVRDFSDEIIKKVCDFVWTEIRCNCRIGILRSSEISPTKTPNSRTWRDGGMFPGEVVYDDGCAFWSCKFVYVRNENSQRFCPFGYNSIPWWYNIPSGENQYNTSTPWLYRPTLFFITPIRLLAPFPLIPQMDGVIKAIRYGTSLEWPRCGHCNICGWEMRSRKNLPRLSNFAPVSQAIWIK